MKFFKALLKKLKDPTAAVATVSAILLLVAVGGVFACIFLEAPHAVAYVFYGVSALFLGYFIYVAVYGWLKVRPRFYGWAEKHRFARKFVGDLTFRTMIFAAVGMFINVGYATFNAVYGIIIALHYGLIATSIWYCAVATYFNIWCGWYRKNNSYKLYLNLLYNFKHDARRNYCPHAQRKHK